MLHAHCRQFIALQIPVLCGLRHCTTCIAEHTDI